MDDTKRNVLVSYSAGTMFSIGWWMLIDASALGNYRYATVDPTFGQVPGYYYVPALLSTLALFVVNILPSPGSLTDSFASGGMSKRVAFGFFLAFMLSFGALFWSSWIFFEDYVANPKTVPASIAALLGADGSAAALWPGLAVFLQNLLIFASSMLFRFARAIDDL